MDGGERFLSTSGFLGKAKKVRISMHGWMFNLLSLTASSQVSFDTEDHAFEVVKIAPTIRLLRQVRLYQCHNQPLSSRLRTQTPELEADLADFKSVTTSDDVVSCDLGSFIRRYTRILVSVAPIFRIQSCLRLQKHLGDLYVYESLSTNACFCWELVRSQTPVLT
jgi:hypothetical protein